MKTQRYTIAEAQKHFEKLIQEAERGDDVYIVEEKKQMVKVVSLAEDRNRRTGDSSKAPSTPDTFDPLTDEESKELGFE